MDNGFQDGIGFFQRALLAAFVVGVALAAVLILLSLEKIAPKMPAAVPVYESRAALASLSLPIQYSATVTQPNAKGVLRTRYYSPREAM